MTDTERTPAPGAQEWAWTTVGSSIGPVGLAATPRGLLEVALRADGPTAAGAVDRLIRRLGTGPAAAPSASHDVLAEAAAELAAYFAGRRRTFSVPLDWSLTAGFHREVLRELAAHVPYGSVVSYQDLADRVGEPGAARAVGTAMGGNPLPIVVPCHRVVESGGGLGGFGSGLEVKRALLSLEGVLPQPLF
ncbi:methylated-DNA--[protein]-cysteine S-methyltransferase [Streptomyces sp. ISL-11]|uniref:methylated-DNA--[protein]-cysteine S-methyltransferase n=1 Tax=Streptomyces sp. ISL-11 TaxID=2819174 RepID=UPI001BEAFFDB|nr:methylated-DNA--[protein]-cysteine S-methyltransferase [Streptomyces sp. ISL-11]MBT2387786.1 methylated-DNA--[protein]-cysteine S-methyltransferase [Streptomyces sp. ISL-11]